MEQLQDNIRDVITDAVANGLKHRSHSDKVWDRIIRVTTSVVGPALIGCAWGYINLHNRVQYIENTRFTRIDYETASKDAEARSSQKLAAIDRALTELRTLVETMRTDANRNGERLARMEAKLDGK